MAIASGHAAKIDNFVRSRDIKSWILFKLCSYPLQFCFYNSYASTRVDELNLTGAFTIVCNYKSQVSVCALVQFVNDHTLYMYMNKNQTNYKVKQKKLGGKSSFWF